MMTVVGFLTSDFCYLSDPLSLSHSLSVKQFKIIIAIVIVLVGEEPNKKSRRQSHFLGLIVDKFRIFNAEMNRKHT